MQILYSLLEAFAIVFALSVDALVTGFAYGAKRIAIPVSSTLLISAICSAFLGAALYLGDWIGGYMPYSLTAAVCFALLSGLGASKIFESAIKNFITRHSGFQKDIRFRAFHLGFLLRVFAEPEEADRDGSKVLSARESVMLAVALSFDSVAAGFGTGMAEANPLLLTGLSLAMNVLCIVAGCRIGRRIARQTRLDLSWLSGLLLLALAVSKLFA